MNFTIGYDRLTSCVFVEKFGFFNGWSIQRIEIGINTISGPINLELEKRFRNQPLISPIREIYQILNREIYQILNREGG